MTARDLNSNLDTLLGPGTLSNSQITTELLSCVVKVAILSAKGGVKQNYSGSIWNVLVAQIQIWNPYLPEFGVERTQNLAAPVCPETELLHMALVLEMAST